MLTNHHHITRITAEMNQYHQQKLSDASSSVDQGHVLRPLSSASSKIQQQRPYLRQTSTPQSPTPQTPDEHYQQPPLLYSNSDNPEGDNDEIPSVRPVVDNHDRLWAEIDVLDDAAYAAQQAKLDKSFFGPSHAEALEKLKDAQAALVNEMAQSDQSHDKDKYKSLWQNSDIESLRRNLFDEEQFDSISQHVSKTREHLDNVAKFMDTADEQQTKELGNNGLD